MLLDHTTSCLIIIDVQEKLMPAIEDQERVITNCASLVTAAQRFSVPMIMTEQYPQGLGLTVGAVGDCAKGQAQIIDKISFSAMKHDPFKNYISELASPETSQIILAGVEAHICVLQTALDLRNEGYQVFVVADAIGSRKEASIKIALERLAMNGVQLITTEMMLFEWTGSCDSPAFKDIRSLVV